MGRSLALPALTLALLIAGCGGGTRTVTVSGPPPAAKPSRAAKQAKPARTSAPTSVVHEGAFQTPSGNIGCMIDGGSVRCDIARRSWSPPARPSSCPDEVDYGQGLEVGETGAPRFVCAGDTVREPGAPKLAYGAGDQLGSLLCVSAEDGLTCRANGGSGHGFFLSIQSYRLY